MKKIIITICSALLFWACEKKIIREVGRVDIAIEGNKWEWAIEKNAYYEDTPNSKTAIVFLGFNEYKELREHLAFQNIELDTNRDTIFLNYIDGRSINFPEIPTASFSTFTSDGDVHSELFFTSSNEAHKNWLLLDKIKRNRLEGTFHIHLARPEGTSIHGRKYPDTLQIEGAFLVKQDD
ncbi:MAG: hypothetical protein AAGG68_06855 [Bacteroidota bacterium]